MNRPIVQCLSPALISAFYCLSAAGVEATKPWPHEPEGFAALSDFGFDAKDGNGWRKVYDGGAISQDPDAPFSPPNVLEYWWDHNQGYGNVSNTEIYLPPRTNELYLAFWWKPSNPFRGWSTNQNKVVIVWNDGDGVERHGKMYLSAFEGSQTTSGPYKIFHALNYPQNNCHLPGNGDCPGPGAYNLRGDSEMPTIELGKWHLVEFHGKAGATDSSNDGIFQYWFDGKLVNDFKTFNYPGQFSRITFAPVWDALETVMPDAKDHHYFDHVRISVPASKPDSAGKP